MDTGDVIIAGGGWIRLIPADVTEGTTIIEVWKTAIDLLVVSAEGEEVANNNQDTTYITLVSSNGITYRYPQIQKTVDLVSGNEVAPGDNKDSITFTASIGYADWQTIVSILRNDLTANKDAVVAVVCGAGKEAYDGATEGTLHLCGKISGNPTRDKSHEIVATPLTISGGITYTSTPVFTAYNTIAEASITPGGGSAVTPDGLLTGDYSGDFLEGKIVYIDA